MTWNAWKRQQMTNARVIHQLVKKCLAQPPMKRVWRKLSLSVRRKIMHAGMHGTANRCQRMFSVPTLLTAPKTIQSAGMHGIAKIILKIAQKKPSRERL